MAVKKQLKSTKKKEPKKAWLFKFDIELIEALREEADKERRAFNNYVELTLKDHITGKTGKKFEHR
jgi:hypothetical protein